MGYQVEFFSSPPPQIGQLYTFGGSNLYQIRKNNIPVLEFRNCGKYSYNITLSKHQEKCAEATGYSG